jgi:hypothetical protein
VDDVDDVVLVVETPVGAIGSGPFAGSSTVSIR